MGPTSRFIGLATVVLRFDSKLESNVSPNVIAGSGIEKLGSSSIASHRNQNDSATARRNDLLCNALGLAHSFTMAEDTSVGNGLPSIRRRVRWVVSGTLRNAAAGSLVSLENNDGRILTSSEDTEPLGLT